MKSAMSMRYLGESIDLHTGGIDNIFPHHEDEIAQSEAATGRPFVKYWMHCAHLNVEGRKMAKSLGNFYTLADITKRGYSGREIRYVLISTHYRQSLNFSFKELDASRVSLRRLDEFGERLRLAGQTATAIQVPEWVTIARNSFGEALDDDLNISEALATLFGLVHTGNKLLDDGATSPEDALGALALLDEMDRVLGFLHPETEETPLEVIELADLRQKARSDREWDEADRLRNELVARGWLVQDAPEGYKLKRK